MNDPKSQAYAEVLRKEIATWIAENSNNRSLITITNIEVAKGFKNAMVFVSVLPEDQADFVIKFLERKVRDIQKYLQNRINHRRLPFLRFTHDKTEVLREKLYKLEAEEKDNEAENSEVAE